MVSVFVFLTSLHIIPSKTIHAVAKVKISFCFTAKYSVAYMKTHTHTHTHTHTPLYLLYPYIH